MRRMVAGAIGDAIQGGMEVFVGHVDCVAVLCNHQVLHIACPSLLSALNQHV